MLVAFVNDTTRPQAIVVMPNVALQDLIDAHLQLQLGVERSPVLEQLAPPLVEQRAPYLNHHIPGQPDTIRVLYYDGLELAIYEVSHSNKAFIIYLKVTLPHYQTAEGLRVGETRAEVENILGMPDATEDSTSVYNLSVAGDQLRVTFKENQVTRLEWQFYWD